MQAHLSHPLRQSVFTAAVFALAICSLGGCATGSQQDSGDTKSTAQPTTHESQAANAAEHQEALTAKDLALNRGDVAEIVRALSDDFVSSKLTASWKSAAGNTPKVIVVPFRNDLTGKYSGWVGTVSDILETDVVNKTAADAYSLDMNAEKLAKAEEKFPNDELEALAEFGRLAQVDYILSGRASADKKPEPPTKSVTYTIELYVVDVAGEKIVHESTTELTKPD